MYRIIGPHNNYTFSNIDITLLALLLVWELFWKGLALWKAGRNNQSVWFICLLIINTAGILEIAYLLLFQKRPVPEAAEKYER